MSHRSMDSRLYFQGPEFAGNNFSPAMVNIFGATCSQLCNFVDMGEKYWGSNLTGGWLSFATRQGNAIVNVSPQLLISFHRRFGFQFFEVSNDSDCNYRLAIDPDATEIESVEMDCQSLFFFPSNSFHSAVVAKQIIEKFIESRGEIAYQSCVWVEANDDFTDPVAWKRFAAPQC